MSFDEINSVWRSAHNQPSAEVVEREKHRLLAKLRHDNRVFILFISVVAAVLSAATAVMVLHVIAPGPGREAIDPAREWGALLLLLLPWIGLAILVRRHLRHRREHPRAAESISAAVNASLDENRHARARLKIIVVLNALMILLMPFIVHQLRATGKAGDEITVPATVMFPALMIFVFAAMWHHDRRELLPRQRELEALQRDYESRV